MASSWKSKPRDSILPSMRPCLALTGPSLFITTGVSWFAEENKITFAKAYQFLLLYKGIDFLESSFRYEQTLPRTVVLQDLSRVCANNGGRL